MLKYQHTEYNEYLVSFKLQIKIFKIINILPKEKEQIPIYDLVCYKSLSY